MVFQNNPTPPLTQHFTKGLTYYENERPLRGEIAELDWLHRGWFTRWIRQGILTGKQGEICYLPLKTHHQTFHFVVLGAGMNPQPETHPPLTPEQQTLLQKTFDRLGLTSHGKL